MQGPLDMGRRHPTPKQMLRRPTENQLATLGDKADVAVVGGPDMAIAATMEMAGEGLGCFQVFDLAGSLKTSWTKLGNATNLKLPWVSGI